MTDKRFLRRNVAARALELTQFRKRTIPSKKLYKRKPRTNRSGPSSFWA
jgi:hypothetical protein